MNDQVAEYSDLVESLAAALVNSSSAIMAGVEYDDLYQEGLIQVWQSLERGVTPTQVTIKNRMVDWIRHMQYQTGQTLPGCEKDPDTRQLLGECTSFVPYEQLLPLEEFHLLERGA